MATINNISYYEKMKSYNLQQFKTAVNAEDRAYYKMMAEHWTKKIELVTPKEPKVVNRSFVVWR